MHVARSARNRRMAAKMIHAIEMMKATTPIQDDGVDLSLMPTGAYKSVQVSIAADLDAVITVDGHDVEGFRLLKALRSTSGLKNRGARSFVQQPPFMTYAANARSGVPL